MPTKEDLLLEKRRYNLPLEISKNEEKMLKLGYPVQKIIGYVDLANVRIDVSQKVLIPRYETEELIFYALQWIKKYKFVKILDLCSGSGFIGIALKKNNPSLTVTCVDIDNEAIASSQQNAKLNSVNIEIIQSDLFENVNDKYDLIISNPPYLSNEEILNQSVLDFEPHLALFAQDNGLFFYKQILKDGWKYLNQNGMIMFEINPFQSEFWVNMKKVFNIKIIKDISGKERFVIVWQKNSIS
ncbi:peptide chain release factor N(5)-glutamine methyltransferase [Mycoplasmopsis citelli]|uniref:peptide chain release factor N(5)-glutamine methyltransferase n=1 Tax=Mycoplasmopsis citelli TaxID=171281 RepID=UPI002114FE71|nr:peptide chain release factor N(5)-glutamine methyltransferase [Mycoplasmopsis citelli]UUD36434.1 peptide chain release factor N(5)-glutamine methyltransferase [Mycoplasmopsis citelli]